MKVLPQKAILLKKFTFTEAGIMVTGMKVVKHLVLVVILALLAGCATTFRPWMLSEVQEGMDKDQVIQILGEPDSIDVQDGTELLQYVYSESYNPTSVSGTIETPDSPNNLQDWDAAKSFKEYKYVVELVDGKVLSYKEVQE